MEEIKQGPECWKCAKYSAKPANINRTNNVVVQDKN